ADLIRVDLWRHAILEDNFSAVAHGKLPLTGLDVIDLLGKHQNERNFQSLSVTEYLATIFADA
ncbi:hypothetical protein, partial [Pseudomonas syringae group genomosp. 7]|uniref:hypothetical protein n=1 Tax=Pseudomonas syringae group genomosp. 7 TaxID=251699 RepID=UPI00376FDC7D